MKSKFIIICGSLIILLSFNVFHAFSKSPDIATYEKNYHQYVDSKESLLMIKHRDAQLYKESIHYLNKHPLIPSYRINYGQDSMQDLDIYVPKISRQAPVIFFIHGIFSDKTQVQAAVKTWVSMGYLVVSISYRQVPGYKFQNQLEDCFLALKWVMDNIDKYGGDGNRIAMTGISWGGYLTSLVVAETKWHKMYGIEIRKIKCWIPLSGFYSMSLRENYLSPEIAGYLNLMQIQAEKDASPIDYISGKEPPSLIIHGRDDWAVPRTNATALYNKLKEKGATTELAILKGYMHSDVFMGYYKKDHMPAKLIKRFLAKHMPADENH